MPAVRAARRALPAVLLLALGLVAPAGAQAAATMSVGGSTLTFMASDGLDHRTYPYLATNGHLRIEDLGGIALGASGCTSVSAGVVDCGAPSAFTRLVVSFGAGDDTVAVADGLHLPVTVDGGAGDDDMEGGDQGDVLDGGDGADTVYGNGGADVVRGGPGNDEIGGGTGVDTLDGGTGNDAVGAWDEAADVAPVTCGSGLDTVDYDYGLDTISSDCETLPPHIEGPVLISGQPTVGMVLTRSTPATSGGTPTAWYTYWKRCDAWHWECEDIPGAEDASYRLTAEDRGALIQVAVYAGNGAGYDGVVSDPTAVIGVPDPTLEPRAAGPPPATTLPLPYPVASAFSVAGPPALAVRGATATVDTGRTVACPAGGPACRLSATARPAGASGKVRGRPTIAGTARIRLRAGASAKVAIRLTPKAARLLRSKGRITLAVSAVLERGAVRHAASSFAVTVKAPKRKR
jgi:hypothetical protein